MFFNYRATEESDLRRLQGLNREGRLMGATWAGIDWATDRYCVNAAMIGQYLLGSTDARRWRWKKQK